jgi:hypothetical protein
MSRANISTSSGRTLGGRKGTEHHVRRARGAEKVTVPFPDAWDSYEYTKLAEGQSPNSVRTRRSSVLRLAKQYPGREPDKITRGAMVVVALPPWQSAVVGGLGAALAALPAADAVRVAERAKQRNAEVERHLISYIGCDGTHRRRLPRLLGLHQRPGPRGWPGPGWLRGHGERGDQPGHRVHHAGKSLLSDRESDRRGGALRTIHCDGAHVARGPRAVAVPEDVRPGLEP